MRTARRIGVVLMWAALAGCGAAAPATDDSSQPSATARPATDSPSPFRSHSTLTPSADPTASPAASTSADLEFTTSLLGSAAGHGSVHSIMRHREGLLAVGVEYEGKLPLFGPTPPHEGRVWSSADGQSWEDVTPDGVFANTSLSAVIRRSDATLLTVGTVSEEDEYGGVSITGFGAWESEAGRTWTPALTGLPEDRWIRAAVQGERGVLADVWQVGATHGSEVWYSSDGRTWEVVRQFGDGLVDLDAGEEGFVIAGTEGAYGEPGIPFAIASADGREWFEAPHPPDGAVGVAALGADWVALTVARPDGLLPTSMTTWHSANGLDWSRSGDIDLALTHPDAECPLEPSLVGAGSWLVLRSYWSGLCSEGGGTSFGPHLLSSDGQAWHLLPFAASGESERGSWVNASAVLHGAVVLAGESNGQAAFWFGDHR